MTRQGPDYHDDPRLEAGDAPEFTPKTEADNRRARRGSDMARLALGLEEENTLESKIEFTSDEAQRLSGLIEKSDLSNPNNKNRIRFMIDAALQRGATSPEESAGLKHFLEHSEGLSDTFTAQDVQSLQHKNH